MFDQKHKVSLFPLNPPRFLCQAEAARSCFSVISPSGHNHSSRLSADVDSLKFRERHYWGMPDFNRAKCVNTRKAERSL